MHNFWSGKQVCRQTHTHKHDRAAEQRAMEHPRFAADAMDGVVWTCCRRHTVRTRAQRTPEEALAETGAVLVCRCRFSLSGGTRARSSSTSIAVLGRIFCQSAPAPFRSPFGASHAHAARTALVSDKRINFTSTSRRACATRGKRTTCAQS